MDPSVAAMFGDSNRRKDLFNLWLSHAKDFGKVTLEVARRNTQRQAAQSSTVTWSRAQLEQRGRYEAQDITDLIQRAVASGRYIDDPNFPGNERLRRYLVVDDVSLSNAQVREDIQEIGNSGTISSQEAMTLTAAGVMGSKFVQRLGCPILGFSFKCLDTEYRVQNSNMVIPTSTISAVVCYP